MDQIKLNSSKFLCENASLIILRHNTIMVTLTLFKGGSNRSYYSMKQAATPLAIGGKLVAPLSHSITPVFTTPNSVPFPDPRPVQPILPPPTPLYNPNKSHSDQRLRQGVDPQTSQHQPYTLPYTNLRSWQWWLLDNFPGLNWTVTSYTSPRVSLSQVEGAEKAWEHMSWWSIILDHTWGPTLSTSSHKSTFSLFSTSYGSPTWIAK